MGIEFATVKDAGQCLEDSVMSGVVDGRCFWRLGSGRGGGM
ncbi:hypothetical protein M3J09_005525 [Ascochyta lentis]